MGESGMLSGVSPPFPGSAGSWYSGCEMFSMPRADQVSCQALALPGSLFMLHILNHLMAT
jgi:hypothetical protein